MSTDIFIRLQALCIVAMLVLFVPASRRVLMAWSVWLVLRWEWRHERPSVRRWLWIRTLRHADGKDKYD